MNKFLEKRFPKQEIFNSFTPENCLYPISYKRPTKTPEKANLDPQKPATRKKGKRVEAIGEEERQKGVEATDENPEASKDFSVSDQVRVIPDENEKRLT